MNQPAPVIVTDTREQTPLQFSRLANVVETLLTGDYSVECWEEHFAVERKTIGDLVGCCVGDSRTRFERELHRLRGFRFKRLLIVGTRTELENHRYHSKVLPASILGSLAAWEIRYDVPVIFAPTADEAATLVERWEHYFVREQTRFLQKEKSC